MKTFVAALCVLATTTLCNAYPVHADNLSAQAEDVRNVAGYGKTVWGMTVAEVLNSDPDRIKKFEPPKQFRSSTAFLGIDDIKIGVNDFKIFFLFSNKDQRLTQVNLSSIEQSNRAINKRTFINIERLLTEKYGPPTSKQENKKVSWKFPNTLIELTHFDILGITTEIIVSYKPSATRTEDSKDL